MTQTDPALLTTPPSAAPRELTSRVRRRSWVEPRVRVWWMLAAALIAVAGYFVAVQLARSAQDRWLINNGTAVQAKVLDANGNPLQNKNYPPEDRAVFKLRYEIAGKTPVEMTTQLKDQRAAVITGGHVKLFVDPNNPSRWTDRTEIDLAHDTLVGVMLAPIALILLIVAFVKRAGILRVWRTGAPLRAIVVDARQTAAAPLSRLVRFTPGGTGGKRIFTTLIPARLGAPRPGDAIWLIAPENRPRQAIVPAAYAGPKDA